MYYNILIMFVCVLKYNFFTLLPAFVWILKVLSCDTHWELEKNLRERKREKQHWICIKSINFNKNANFPQFWQHTSQLVSQAATAYEYSHLFCCRCCVCVYFFLHLPFNICNIKTGHATLVIWGGIESIQVILYI